jgi:ABC-type nitrate/sulfonate/bicarbonate transport system ATPase subunit
LDWRAASHWRARLQSIPISSCSMSPFVSLDAELALRLREELAELVDRRSPMTLLVTHNLDEAIGLADRLLFLSPSPARILAEIPVVSPRGTQVPEQTAALRAEITRCLKP